MVNDHLKIVSSGSSTSNLTSLARNRWSTASTNRYLSTYRQFSRTLADFALTALGNSKYRIHHSPGVHGNVKLLLASAFNHLKLQQ
jgi:hypothetical protein